jgi:hypothetical protein
MQWASQNRHVAEKGSSLTALVELARESDHDDIIQTGFP